MISGSYEIGLLNELTANAGYLNYFIYYREYLAESQAVIYENRSDRAAARGPALSEAVCSAGKRSTPATRPGRGKWQNRKSAPPGNKGLMPAARRLLRTVQVLR